MPGPYVYPGVYIEEIPSGVRTIAGVGTSDTAFVDFFKRGPEDEAVRITSFGDFERVFGGLDPRSEASYAIKQYYLNGGNVCWVVRVKTANAQTAKLTLKGGSPEQNTLALEAASYGKWGNGLRVAADIKTSDPNKLFNLAVRLVETVNESEQIVAVEAHRNLSMDINSPRYVGKVLDERSDLIVLSDTQPGLGHLPTPTGTDVITKPKDTDFLKLGQELDAGSDGDAPPGFPGDTGGAQWLVTGAQKLTGVPADKTGMYALETIAPYIFNLLCIPAAANLPEANMIQVYQDATKFCRDQRAFLIVDIPESKNKLDTIEGWSDLDKLRDDHAAVYFPRIEILDPLDENRPRNAGPSGTLAGIYARTDATRGVWKAPAGTEASLRGANITIRLTDLETGGLNPFGVNVLRSFPIYGNVSWGARTLDGADLQASEWKYIPVRRVALYIEESLYQGLKWVVFEPNDEPLWAQIRLNVGAFMHNLFRQGAFQGTTPRDAYFVKCDKETTTQNDIDNGIVNILVGFAPLKPAEFVVIKIQQIAGQVQT